VSHTFFGLPVGNTRAFIEQRDLSVAADLGPEELSRRYLTRKDGTRGAASRTGRQTMGKLLREHALKNRLRELLNYKNGQAL
jgi:hypothetical protein